MTDRSLIEVMADIAATPAEIEETLVAQAEWLFNNEFEKGFSRMAAPGKFRLMVEARLRLFLSGRRFSGFKQRQMISRIQAEFTKDYKKVWKKMQRKSQRSSAQQARDRRKGRWI